MRKETIYTVVIALSILGVLVSGYLLYIHYSILASPCDLNGTFQCSLVNRSVYSEILGIPVALLGLIGYSILGIGNFLLLQKRKVMGVTSRNLFLFSLIAVGVSLYLTYAEFFILKAICLFCVISQIDIIVISFLTYTLQKLKRENR